MTKLNQRSKRTVAVVAALIVLAIVCRVLGNNGFYPRAMGLVRSIIYIFLFAVWGFSLQRRIIQNWQRRYMAAIAICMSFWFSLRTLKYHFIPAATMPGVARLAWYAYYIPMLLIPMLALFTAVSLGKPEHYRSPHFLHLLWIPTVLLVLTVLTNDLHQTVFVFPKEYPIWTDDHYSYGPMYGVTMLWILLCGALALGIIFRKCRLPRSKRVLWLPLVPFCLMLAYAILYITGIPVIRLFLGDLTSVSCLLIALIFESCIQCGLIRSNSHYAELFRASAIAAQITDRDLNVCYAAQAIQPVEKPVLERAKQKTVILDGGIRLCAEPIRGGYVFWQEDISALLALLDELSGTKEELESYNGLLEEENKQKRRRKRLEEQKRLFNMVQETIKPHLLLLSEVSKQLQTAGTEDAARKALGKLAVIGAYLKRRSNLIMLSDSLGQTPAEELHLCLQESEANLRLCGVTCALRFDLAAQLPFDAVGTLFDFYETAVEMSLDTLTDLTVFVAGNAWSPRLTLMLSCDADLAELSTAFESASLTKEDGVWYCALTLTEGGDTP